MWLWLAIASPAHAAPGQVLADKDAQAHFERAQQHFAAEDYAAAIPELKAAYALEPNPMLLYAWGQAERLAGNCARAVDLYRRYLDTNPAEEQRQLTEANLVDCEAELPPDAAVDPLGSEPDSSLAPDEPDPPVEPPPDEPARPWIKDPLGGVLLGFGAVGVATGGALMGVARRRGKQAPNADVEDDYLEIRATAVRMNTAGIVTLGVGSALVVIAAVRYAIVAKKRRTTSVSRSTPTWTGHGVGLRVEF